MMRVTFALGVLVFVVLAFLWLTGCEVWQRDAQYPAPYYYAFELNQCVDQSSTREEADACLCEVKARYKRPTDGCRDGGR